MCQLAALPSESGPITVCTGYGLAHTACVAIYYAIKIRELGPSSLPAKLQSVKGWRRGEIGSVCAIL